MTSCSSSMELNFMGGKSYTLNPLQKLMVVCTSMICGESQYYRPKSDHHQFQEHFLFSGFYSDSGSNSSKDYFDKIVDDALVFHFQGCLEFVSKLRNEYYMRRNSNYLLVKALQHPTRPAFNKSHPTVCKTAIEQVGCLPTDWTTQYKLLKESDILKGSDPDILKESDILKGSSGKQIPTIWKRTIAKKLEQMTAYHAAKYLHGSKTEGNLKTEGNMKTEGNLKTALKNHNTKQNPSEEENPNSTDHLANMVDLIRITHPRPTDVLNQLIKTGKVIVADDEHTWEQLRSAKKTWLEINRQIRLPHMALLRNLRNILKEYCLREDVEDALQDIHELTEQLVGGVRGGKQFPFRYFSAYKSLKADNDNVAHESNPFSLRNSCVVSPENHRSPTLSASLMPRYGLLPDSLNLSTDKEMVFDRMKQIMIDGLNRCVLESIECIPPMKGRVDCLTDNSGSARKAFVSEYGTVNVYEISNLSAILTAYRATEGGSVWIFGDRLIEYVVTKKPILEQLEEVNDLGSIVGMHTETGLWLFWEKCIETSAKLDTVFIYSDMQAGTGKLYATESCRKSLNQMDAVIATPNPNGSYAAYIDVLKLVEIYRKQVNAKVNLFSVQVAGYDNSILPDILYRGAILSGWTGKEAKLAYEMNELWDSVEFWGDNSWDW